MHFINYRAPLRLRRRAALFLIILAAVMIPVNLLFGAAEPLISGVAETRALQTIGTVVEKCAADRDYAEFVTVGRGEDGTVFGLFCDTQAVNEFRSEFSLELARRLEKNASQVSVSAGDIIGAAATAGRGPSIICRITGYSAAVSEIRSELCPAGINQSLYRLTMTVSVRCRIILPRRRIKEVEYLTSLPLAETVIIGDVPGYYLNYQ